MNSQQMFNLGQVWGLHFQTAARIMKSDTYHDEMVDAWLKKQEDVSTRCPPTWRNLVKSLKHERVKQNGIAEKVEQERCTK